MTYTTNLRKEILLSMQFIGPTQLQPIPVFLYKKSWPPVQVDHLGCCTIGWLSRSFLRAFLKSDLSTFGTCLQGEQLRASQIVLPLHKVVLPKHASLSASSFPSFTTNCFPRGKRTTFFQLQEAGYSLFPTTHENKNRMKAGIERKAAVQYIPFT